MSNDARFATEKSLSPKQMAAIGHLVQGMPMGEIAGKVGINEKTLWRWRQDAAFQAGLRQAENALFDESISVLKRTMKAAIFCLVRNMSEKVTPYVQVQAASKLLDAGVEVHKISELESKIALFEQLVKEAGLR